MYMTDGTEPRSYLWAGGPGPSAPAQDTRLGGRAASAPMAQTYARSAPMAQTIQCHRWRRPRAIPLRK